MMDVHLQQIESLNVNLNLNIGMPMPSLFPQWTFPLPHKQPLKVI